MPLIALSGKEQHLSRRHLLALLRKAESPLVFDSPQNVGSIEGADLLVIHNPEDIKDLSFYKSLDQMKTPTTVLYFAGDPKGNTKIGKFVSSLPKEQQKTFPLPPPWKLREEASRFLEKEMKSHGKVFSHKDLPSLVVERVGTDLGVLSYEALKLAYASDPENTVTPEHVKGSVSLVFDVGMEGLVKGLRHRDAKAVARSLYALNPAMKKETIFRILGHLEYHVFDWLRAAPHVKLSPDEAAGLLGMKPYPYKENILPAIKKWSFSDLRKLIAALASGSRSVKDGNLFPAYQFFSTLLLTVG